jgi:hypothetical protein
MVNYKTIAAISTMPSAIQQSALPRSPASQYPVAALKQRKALVHPLPHAAGLLSVLRRSMQDFTIKRWQLKD